MNGFDKLYFLLSYIVIQSKVELMEMEFERSLSELHVNSTIIVLYFVGDITFTPH